MSDDKLIKAAVNASNTIHAVYQWIDMIEAEGGAGTIAGVAKCNAFLKSMKGQRNRLDKLIMQPLEEELSARQKTPT